MYPSLTPRLRIVAGLVPKDARLADVGTDHAYLPANLLATGHIPAAIATDVRPGPLARARDTAERYGLQDRLDLRLCDGLAGVDSGEVDAVVIAGMGGETILGILEAAPWSLDKTCILQPMSAMEVLRAGLDRLGIGIPREVLIQEGNTLYLTILLEGQTVLKERSLTPAETYVGTLKAHENDPLWPEYLTLSYHRVKRALSGLEHSKKPEDAPRKHRLNRVLDGLAEMKKEMGLP